ncbi:hypothetical protein D3C72_1199620 [compost metagenome]
MVQTITGDPLLDRDVFAAGLGHCGYAHCAELVRDDFRQTLGDFIRARNGRNIERFVKRGVEFYDLAAAIVEFEKRHPAVGDLRVRIPELGLSREAESLHPSKLCQQFRRRELAERDRLRTVVQNFDEEVVLKDSGVETLGEARIDTVRAIHQRCRGEGIEAVAVHLPECRVTFDFVGAVLAG